MSGSRVIAVAWQYIELKHNSNKCVYHTVHELADNVTVGILLTLGSLLVRGVVLLGQVRSDEGVGQVLIPTAGYVGLFDDGLDYSGLVHIAVEVPISIEINTNKFLVR